MYTLGFSIVLPFLVYIVMDFGGNEWVYGVVGATYSGMQMIGSPLMGRWSDRLGRKKLLLLSQAGTVLAWGLFLTGFYLPEGEGLSVRSEWMGHFLLTPALGMLVAARALDGLTGGNVSVAQAYLADISTQAQRRRHFGWMGVAGNMGFILGPALAGLLGAGEMGYALPVWVTLGISLLALIYLAWGLPEPRHSKLSGAARPRSHRTGARLGFLLRFPPMPRLFALYFLIFLAFNIFYTAFPAHAAQALRWKAGELGLFLAFLSGGMALVQGPLLGWLSRRYYEIPLMLTGGVFMVACFGLLTQPQVGWIYLAAACFALGNGLMWPSFLALLARMADGPYQGSVQGYGTAMGSLASILGLLTGGALYHLLEEGIFWISAGIFALSLLMVWGLSSTTAPPWPEAENAPFSSSPDHTATL